MNILRSIGDACQSFGERTYDVFATQARVNPANIETEGTFENQYFRIGGNFIVITIGTISTLYLLNNSLEGLSKISQAEDILANNELSDNQHFLLDSFLTGAKFSLYASMTAIPFFTYKVTKAFFDFINTPRGLIQNEHREALLRNHKIELLGDLTEAIDLIRAHEGIQVHQRNIKNARNVVHSDDYPV